MDFLDKIDSDSIILIPNNIKNKVLTYINENKLLINIKIMSFNDLLHGLYYSYTNEAIVNVMRSEKVTFETAKDFIKNTYYLNGENEDKEKIKFIKKIKDDLSSKNLLIKDPLFIDLLKSKEKLYVFGFTTFNNLETSLLDEASKYIKIEKIKTEEKDYKHIAHKLGTLEEEVIYVAEQITKLVNNGIDINNINLANYSDEYYFSINKIFNLYKIPVSLKEQTKLSDTTIGKYFIHNLNNDIESLLEDMYERFDIENNIYNKKVFKKINELINSYYWVNEIIDVIDAIEAEMKTIKISEDHYEKEIRLTEITDNIFSDNEYVFLLGFNQKSIPKSYKDEDYLDDSVKTSLMEDTLTQNKASRIRYSLAIKNIKNLTITLKETSLKSIYLPSTLIDEINIKSEKNEITYSNYSDNYNKLLYSERLDDLIKFNDYKKDIEELHNTYKIPYKEYDNSFTKINSEKVKEKLSTKGFSYSTISTYYKCPFRFYLDYFFRLNEFETTFSTFLGSAFHKVLEECITDESKDIDEVYYNEIEKTKTNLPYGDKEKFYTDKVNEELHFIVENIREQYTHSSHNPNDEEHEKYIEKTTDELKLNTNIKSIIKGFVDKCMFIDNDVIIVDYKTGTSAKMQRDYFKYGVTIQLPIYLYLLKNENKNYNIVGMYLQHILTGIPKSKYDNIKTKMKLDGLTCNDPSKISKFDDSFYKSEVITGLSVNKDGECSKPERMLSQEDEDEIYYMIKNLIEECINNTSDANFDIRPIKDDKVDGCAFCDYKDICFKKPSDIKYINNYDNEEGDTNE